MTSHKELYERAERNGVWLQTTCAKVSLPWWEKLMAGARRADRRRVNRILVRWGYLSREDARLRNPYRPLMTQTHIIWVYSGIEHFFRIQDG